MSHVAAVTPNELKHLRRLSTVRSGKNIKFLTPAVYSGGWCPMRVACNIVEDIEGLSYLLIGMPECATHSRGMNAMPEGEHGELRRLYTLDANEVVFGCREGVMGALRTMDSEGARAILMIATCVTDLIGEDFEGIIDEMQPKLAARLSFVALGQFKCFGASMGTWQTAEAMGRMMAAKPVDGRRANAMLVEPWRNKASPVEFGPVVGALAERGVNIRSLAAGSKLDDFMDAPDASMNLVLCPYTQPLAAAMKAAFGTPYAPLHNAFAVADIDAVYGMIASAFGVDFGDSFDSDRERALALEERARRELCGLRYASMPGVDMPAALALYLAGFGMAPLVMHIEDFHGEDAGYAQALKALGFDPPVCRMMNIDYDIEVVRRLRPDMCVGDIPDHAKGFPCAEKMGDFFGKTGYGRTCAILERILCAAATIVKMEVGTNGAAPL